eukprot:TRINITY_DN13168_c0_g1_i3.p1 TRINITY_DN13168_c0_g1~~TRINITY_DN13168_c0_g1_i3.p1  ORF type:complete len:738 (+),score=198.83 TRINITY_DN13168_c0_g1_i3:84-2297(+)
MVRATQAVDSGGGRRDLPPGPSSSETAAECLEQLREELFELRTEAQQLFVADCRSELVAEELDSLQPRLDALLVEDAYLTLPLSAFRAAVGQLLADLSAIDPKGSSSAAHRWRERLLALEEARSLHDAAEAKEESRERISTSTSGRLQQEGLEKLWATLKDWEERGSPQDDELLYLARLRKRLKDLEDIGGLEFRYLPPGWYDVGEAGPAAGSAAEVQPGTTARLPLGAEEREAAVSHTATLDSAADPSEGHRTATAAAAPLQALPHVGPHARSGLLREMRRMESPRGQELDGGYLGRTPPSQASLSGCFVTAAPLRRSNLRRLLRAGPTSYPLLQELPEGADSFGEVNVVPVHCGGLHCGFSPQPRDPEDTPEDPWLELPYWEAKSIAEALGGQVLTWKEWEVAMRGADCWRYPWGNELDTDEVYMGPPEEVAGPGGEPLALPRARMLGRYATCTSPFGLTHCMQLWGCEWNSIDSRDLCVARVPALPSAERCDAPSTHCIRSLTDHGLLRAALHRDAPDAEQPAPAGDAAPRRSAGASRSHRAFSGPCLSSYSRPHEAVRCCAFRIAIPARRPTERPRAPPPPLAQLCGLLGAEEWQVLRLLGRPDDKRARDAVDGGSGVQWCYFALGILVSSGPDGRAGAEVALWGDCVAAHHLTDDWAPCRVNADPSGERVIPVWQLTAAEARELLGPCDAGAEGLLRPAAFPGAQVQIVPHRVPARGALECLRITSAQCFTF